MDMHKASRRGCHESDEADVCPVPVLTGVRPLDAAILHTRNPSLAEKLAERVPTAKRGR